MAFVVSSGALASLSRERPAMPYTLRIADDLSTAYGALWRSQPAVRTVVTFLGRNIASLGLHGFHRVSTTDRERLPAEHPLARFLGRPNPWTTPYRMIDALVQDLAIYDAAYWLKTKVKDQAFAAVRLSPRTVSPIGTEFYPEAFRVTGERGSRVIPADQVVYFRGYNPDDSVNGSSPIESLRRILAEEYAAGRMREQTLRNGARLSGYIERPREAPSWSGEAKTKFSRAWRSQYAGDGGPEAGGTPVLEDGMTFKQVGQTAEQLQYVEVRKLTRAEVAAAFHIPPPMVGIMESATWANIKEQHQMLYQDTLGPWLSMIADELALQLIPDFPDTDAVYVEFNLEEKLRGSFEDAAQQLQSSVGAPWLTRNEARARRNLPALPGGDDLVTPLNVVIGGQASPRDSGTQNQRSRRTVAAKAEPRARIKAQPREQDEAALDTVLRRFFTRQARAVLSELGAKDADWWDGERWDAELGADLFALALEVTEQIGTDVATSLGFDPEEYDLARTEAFLQTVAASRARLINETTRSKIEAALAGDLEEDALTSTPAGVFEEAGTSRAQEIAVTLATTLASFAVSEAAKQVAPATSTYKTWQVRSGNPRASHALMDGETVRINEDFSNGMAWPGDANGGADEVAGCLCGLEITIQ